MRPKHHDQRIDKTMHNSIGPNDRCRFKHGRYIVWRCQITAPVTRARWASAFQISASLPGDGTSGTDAGLGVCTIGGNGVGTGDAGVGVTPNLTGVTVTGVSIMVGGSATGREVRSGTTPLLCDGTVVARTGVFGDRVSGVRLGGAEAIGGMVGVRVRAGAPVGVIVVGIGACVAGTAVGSKSMRADGRSTVWGEGVWGRVERVEAGRTRIGQPR